MGWLKRAWDNAFYTRQERAEDGQKARREAADREAAENGRNRYYNERQKELEARMSLLLTREDNSLESEKSGNLKEIVPAVAGVIVFIIIIMMIIKS